MARAAKPRRGATARTPKDKPPAAPQSRPAVHAGVPVRRAVCRLLAGRAPDSDLDGASRGEVANILERCCWQILPTLPPLLPAGWMEDPAFVRLTKAAQTITTLGRLQHSLTLELVDLFGRGGIDYVLIKSSAGRYCVYDRPEHRVGSDIDMIVPHDQLQPAERIAREMGFQPAEFDPNLPGFVPGGEARRAEILDLHYELAFLVYRADVGPAIGADGREAAASLPIAPTLLAGRDRQHTWCDVALDIHHAISLDIGGELIFEDASMVDAGPAQLRVPGRAALVFHAIFKLYWEGVHLYEQGLFHYADLVRLVPGLNADECARLIEWLNRYQLNAAGFFVLQRLPKAFATPLPEVLTEWAGGMDGQQRSGKPAQENDVGDVWPRLWGRFHIEGDV